MPLASKSIFLVNLALRVTFLPAADYKRVTNELFEDQSMRILRFTLIFLLLGLPLSVVAEISSDNVPSAAVWYFHADFAAMQSGDAGNRLFMWVDDEVFDEVREESGVDLSKEVDRITAFAAPEKGIVILFDGQISQKSKDKLLALATLSGDMESLGSGDRQYYFVSKYGEHENKHQGMNFDSLEDSAYFSFALNNKVIVTSSEATMSALLANNGKLSVPSTQDGALFVLSADRSLMQAGMNAGEFDYDDDWNSNILKNASQVALLVADEGSSIAVEAQLVTTEPEMAASLASIVRGLISLQAFSDDLDAEVKAVLNSTQVEVDGNSLRIRVDLDPDLVIATISDNHRTARTD